MDYVTIHNKAAAPAMEEENTLRNSDSAENFQHFIYELFEKNGILNDLRAYLRGHIVEVLKSAQSGSTPACQKHFTQRLEQANQALNMLVAEYLLRYDFSYSLSVFVSEIPLANMVFGLAKTLMTESNNNDHSKLWFSESDVWLVLNYLGIKCDSEHASSIVDVYKKKESPLLLCIFKCLPFYCRADVPREHRKSSTESLNDTDKSSDVMTEKYAKSHKSSRHESCKHYAHCKSCLSRLQSVKEKYGKKKKNLRKANISADTQNTENFMKNVSFAEKVLVDEMFHQLKNVYETEVEMVREEEEKKCKQVLAAYAEHLQQRQNEMEESYKQREADLENAVQQKKKFLWGLAQALRDQHQTMEAAMSSVKGESERLSAKENNLKIQLVEAENIIKNRGEAMREQISKEILVLEAHLEAMKSEREGIDREKSELENFKTLCESKVKVSDDSQLESLKKEIVTLKKVVERKMSVVEKCTMTDVDGGGRMNNQDVGIKSDSEERVGRAPNQVVNDLKKQKNVNFSQSQQDTMYQESHRGRIRSHSSDGFDEREYRRDAILVLQDENDRLKTFARQQEQHIDELNIQTARLQAELEAARLRNHRPRTAPTLSTNYEDFERRLNTSISATYDTYSRRMGAGEDSVAIRVRDHIREHARDRRADSRRFVVQQWRALRRGSPLCARRSSPPRAQHAPPTTHMLATASAPSASHSVDREPMRETNIENEHSIQQPDLEDNVERQRPPVHPVNNKPRTKSPKTVLKEAKQKLRNKDFPKNHPQSKREKSPNSVLREAKLRLRKLEIEAEAVEKSYMDFRKRQSMRGETRQTVHAPDDNDEFVNVSTVNNVDLAGKRSPSLLTFREGIHNDSSDLQNCKRNLDKFLGNYKTKFNVADSDFKIKSAKEKAQVIPLSFLDVDKQNVAKKDNSFLETPLSEFRKLYSQNSAPSELVAKQIVEETRTKNKNRNESDKSEVKNRHPKHDQKELQILKENINKIHNLKEEPNVEEIEEINSEEIQDKNVLRIEVECVTKINDLQINESPNDLMLVVHSSAEAREISASDLEGNVSPQMTVIVSPKMLTPIDDIEVKSQDQSSNIPVRLETPEKLTRDMNITSLYHVDNVPVPVQNDSQEFGSFSDRDKAEDYIDDFSADVDNYNSRSEYEGSPISHLKTSEDENFWDN